MIARIWRLTGHGSDETGRKPHVADETAARQGFCGTVADKA